MSTIIWIEKSQITASTIFFKDLGCWSSQGWAHNLPLGRSMGALPTELTGQWLHWMVESWKWEQPGQAYAIPKLFNDSDL